MVLLRIPKETCRKLSVKILAIDYAHRAGETAFKLQIPGMRKANMELNSCLGMLVQL